MKILPRLALFGDSSEVQIPEPIVPPCEDWGTMEKLRREKEVVGIYISGHPLDDFKKEITAFCNTGISAFKDDLESYVNRELTFAGVITDVQHRVSKNGRGWGLFTVEDYTDTHEFQDFWGGVFEIPSFFDDQLFSFILRFTFVRVG